MRLKSELYEKEQNEIIDKVIEILELDDEYSISLYELDRNTEKQNKIMELLPIVRKYFSFANITGASLTDKVKRPWWSIAKYMLKKKYNIYNSDCRLDTENGRIRSTKYVFIKKK